MVLHWYDLLVLTSRFVPGNRTVPFRYELTLRNEGDEALRGFRLGFSGPARVSEGAGISNGHVVTQLSNYCEIAPPKDFVLGAGESWTVDIDRLDYALHHWTDGATTGVLITADGKGHAIRTEPTRLAHGPELHRRGVMDMPLPADLPETISIIPWPREIAVEGRRSGPHGLALHAPDSGTKAVAQSFSALATALFPGEALCRGEAEGGMPVRLALDGNLGAEAYEIDLAGQSATVAGGDATGLLYGLVTLGQMARGARTYPDRMSFPEHGRIVDGPEMGWRGCHLDVARRFYGTDEIKQFLRVMAWNKLNRFHWHLSDDEAWRVEIEAYPELTKVGAWRGHGLAIPPLLGSGPEKTGGYYSKAAIAEVVALGAQLGIEVVPEIDVPGHCYAMLIALPSLRDPGENGLYHSIQSFPNNCLNPGVEAVYPVIEAIFAEMAAMFPSRYFHVGADEVPDDAWASSPIARALLDQLGGGDAATLQAHFLQRIQAMLTGLGKVTGAWEEAAHGGGIDRQACYLVGWTTVAASQALAAEGYEVVVAPGQAYYLDMALTPDWAEPGAHWAGWASLEKTYGFDPAEGWTDEERKKLMGVQACIWSEAMTDRGVFDRLVYPRLSAIAETAWTAPKAKDFSRFSAFAGLMPSLYGTRHEVVARG